MSALTVSECQQTLHRIKDNLGLVIKGKEGAIEIIVIALAAGGSILMEDVPGVGKTTLAKSLTKSIEAAFNRVQFTPDLLPADILGSSIYNPASGDFKFHPGPIFCNVLLADEINRASPRTQSALLEAMSEAQATIEGIQHKLPAPFLVLATQNPVDFHGTYPLPEAQLDRFMVQVNIGYPDRTATRDMLLSQATTYPLDALRPVATGAEVVACQERARAIHVEGNVVDYMIDLIEATRQDERVQLGASPRASIMLFRAVQAAAAFEGREYVTPDDVQRMASHVIPHRLMLTSKARYGGARKGAIVRELIDRLTVPT